MTEHLSVLRRVGWALVVVGALDIGVMIYCVMNGMSYSSSLNIFAVIAAVFLLALLWVYRQLRSPAVVAARVAAGHKPGAPKSAFIAGIALVVGLGVMMQLTMKGESAEKALRLATERYGSDYKYFVSSMNWNGRRTVARLTAYNDQDSKEVEIEWED